MVIWLGETKGLEPYSAYMICSCAGDLKISEIVDQPKWVVGRTFVAGIWVAFFQECRAMIVLLRAGELPHAARDLRHAAHAAQLASS